MTVKEIASQYAVTPSMVKAWLKAKGLQENDDGLTAYVLKRTAGSVNK